MCPNSLRSTSLGSRPLLLSPATVLFFRVASQDLTRSRVLGGGFIPNVLDTSLYDEVIQVTNDEAIDMAGRLPLEEGLFVGIS